MSEFDMESEVGRVHDSINYTRQHLGDTVSSMNQPNQLWHYPGKVDTVSTVLKTHGVHAHRSIVVDRFGLRIDGDERNVPKTFKSGCL